MKISIKNRQNKDFYRYIKAENIPPQQNHIKRFVEQSSSGRKEKIAEGNLDLQKGTKYTRKSNNMQKLNLAPYFTPCEKYT